MNNSDTWHNGMVPCGTRGEDTWHMSGPSVMLSNLCIYLVDMYEA